jgi:hypothetical protein
MAERSFDRARLRGCAFAFAKRGVAFIRNEMQGRGPQATLLRQTRQIPGVAQPLAIQPVFIALGLIVHPSNT